jgi:hypothetical protein
VAGEAGGGAVTLAMHEWCTNAPRADDGSYTSRLRATRSASGPASRCESVGRGPAFPQRGMPTGARPASFCDGTVQDGDAALAASPS